MASPVCLADWPDRLIGSGEGVNSNLRLCVSGSDFFSTPPFFFFSFFPLLARSLFLEKRDEVSSVVDEKIECSEELEEEVADLRRFTLNDSSDLVSDGLRGFCGGDASVFWPCCC